MKNSPFIFIPCLPHHFHPVHRDQTTTIICQSLGSRPTQVQELFTLVPHLFGTTCCCLSAQPFQLLPLGNIWRRISLTWPFSHRYRHARCPVDVTELFSRFCCWTLIRLSRHWAWLRRGYWRYRNLIDWLILSGITDTDVAKRQYVQNQLARVVTKLPPFTRSVPLLCSLHWLPVKFRVDFKICLLTYKTLSEKQPVYLHSLFATPLPSRHRDHIKESLCLYLESRPMLGKGHLAFVPPFSLEQLATIIPVIHFSFHLQDMSQDFFLTWPFPHRHRHACWCSGTASSILLLSTDFNVVPLSFWLRWGYWRYRNWLVDWLIDCLAWWLWVAQSPGSCCAKKT